MTINPYNSVTLFYKIKVFSSYIISVEPCMCQIYKDSNNCVKPVEKNLYKEISFYSPSTKLAVRLILFSTERSCLNIHLVGES